MPAEHRRSKRLQALRAWRRLPGCAAAALQRLPSAARAAVAALRAPLQRHCRGNAGGMLRVAALLYLKARREICVATRQAGDKHALRLRRWAPGAQAGGIAKNITWARRLTRAAHYAGTGRRFVAGQAHLCGIASLPSAPAFHRHV